MGCKVIKGSGSGAAFLTVAGEFKPGDPAPSGYLDWHEWARVQARAGLKQESCGACGLWRFPQQMSERRIESSPFYIHSRSGKRVSMKRNTPVCIECAAAGGA